MVLLLRDATVAGEVVDRDVASYYCVEEAAIGRGLIGLVFSGGGGGLLIWLNEATARIETLAAALFCFVKLQKRPLNVFVIYIWCC